MNDPCTKGTSTQLGGSLSLETCRPGPSLWVQSNMNRSNKQDESQLVANKVETLRMVMVP